MKNKTNCKMRTIIFAFLAALMMLLSDKITKANGSFDAWDNSDKWDIAGDVILNPDNTRRLTRKTGTGVLINGKEGKCPSLVTKRRDYRSIRTTPDD